MSMEVRRQIIVHEEKVEPLVDLPRDLKPNQTIRYNLRNQLVIETCPMESYRRQISGFVFKVVVLQKYFECYKGEDGITYLGGDFYMQRSLSDWSCCVEMHKSSLNPHLVHAIAAGDVTDNILKGICWDLFIECVMNEPKSGDLHNLIKNTIPKYYEWLNWWTKRK
jgi:hypothetical protein